MPGEKNITRKMETTTHLDFGDVGEYSITEFAELLRMEEEDLINRLEAAVDRGQMSIRGRWYQFD